MRLLIYLRRKVPTSCGERAGRPRRWGACVNQVSDAALSSEKESCTLMICTWQCADVVRGRAQSSWQDHKKQNSRVRSQEIHQRRKWGLHLRKSTRSLPHGAKASPSFDAITRRSRLKSLHMGKMPQWGLHTFKWLYLN